MKAHVEVNMPLEITAQEQRLLKNYGRVMEQWADDGSPGWFLGYFRAHKQAHELLGAVLARRKLHRASELS